MKTLLLLTCLSLLACSSPAQVITEQSDAEPACAPNVDAGSFEAGEVIDASNEDASVCAIPPILSQCDCRFALSVCGSVPGTTCGVGPLCNQNVDGGYSNLEPYWYGRLEDTCEWSPQARGQGGLQGCTELADGTNCCDATPAGGIGP